VVLTGERDFSVLGVDARSRSAKRQRAPGAASCSGMRYGR
jgi:hypothetical protein